MVESPDREIFGGGKTDNEDEICEAIFDWWISGKSYEKWFAEKSQQQLPFTE